LLTRGARERFLNEARALARLRHTNVLPVYSVLEDDGQIGLVTEFIEGRPLSRVLEEHGPLGPTEAAQIGCDVCAALAAVHGVGLLHRDVKTANILRESGGRIVLADFGLGVFLPPDTSDKRDNKPKAPLAGSPAFMAPEKIEGHLDQRLDLYALGVVLFHLVTGTLPVVAEDLETLIERIQAGALRRLRDLRPDAPDAFVQVVEKALARRPDDRYQSAGEMEAALRSFLSGTETKQPDEGEPTVATLAGPSSSMRSSRSWGRSVVVAAATLLLIGVTVFLTVHSSPATVQSELYLKRQGEWLAADESGERVGLGTEAYFEFRADRALWFYILNEDEAGNSYLLFPLRQGTLQNPLSRNTTYRLPGRVGAKDVNWQLDSPGGRERIIVVASPAEITELERAADTNGRLGYPTLDRKLVLRSFGLLVEEDSAPSPLAAASGTSWLEFGASHAWGADAVWGRVFILEGTAARQESSQ